MKSFDDMTEDEKMYQVFDAAIDYYKAMLTKAELSNSNPFKEYSNKFIK